MYDRSVVYGPAEWAVVTGNIAPSVLFVRLEASGEEAFLNITGIHDNWLCSSPEYWPATGERIRVCKVPMPDSCGAMGGRAGGRCGRVVPDAGSVDASGSGADRAGGGGRPP